jgi:hypothetical protein
MKRLQPEAGRGLPLTGRLGISTILLVLLLAFTVTGTVNAAPASSLRNASPLQQGPKFQSCHPAEYDVWKGRKHAGAGVDPVFLKEEPEHAAEETGMGLLPEPARV